MRRRGRRRILLFVCVAAAISLLTAILLRAIEPVRREHSFTGGPSAVEPVSAERR